MLAIISSTVGDPGSVLLMKLSQYQFITFMMITPDNLR